MTTDNGMIKVWDPVVRIGHWLLVAAFFTAYFTEDDFLTQHVYAGYLAGIIVAIRLLWGFVGTKHARFSDFLRSPIVTLRYLGDILAKRAARFIGHNPTGGAMIIALLLGVTGTGISGVMLYAVDQGKGPLASWVANSSVTSPVQASGDSSKTSSPAKKKRKDKAREKFWEETHEVFANLTLLLVGLHVAGVLVASLSHKENLVRSMITGRKRRE